MMKMLSKSLMNCDRAYLTTDGEMSLTSDEQKDPNKINEVLRKIITTNVVAPLRTFLTRSMPATLMKLKATQKRIINNDGNAIVNPEEKMSE